ncbi:hypothetical protein Plhal304r1_c007g0028081 [Plasmopara halstedii]
MSMASVFAEGIREDAVRAVLTDAHTGPDHHTTTTAEVGGEQLRVSPHSTSCTY